MKTKILFLALFIMNIFQMSAQSKDEITLVVSADGATKEEATKTALRSAIEQAYGTFVSANTTILNDELVKDEIVTISNGNIKDYKEISNLQLSNGRISVTLQATVCISKLVSYAQSKGASTEFAGAAFAMNMKMKELNKKNEMAVLENLLVQVKRMLPYAFDRELVIGSPKEVYFKEHPYHMLGFLKVTAINSGVNVNDIPKFGYMEEIIPKILKLGGTPVENVYNLLNNYSNYYEIPMKIQLNKNENTLQLFRLIMNTLESVALKQADLEEMKEQRIKYSSEYRAGFVFPDKGDSHYRFYFRNSDEDIYNWSIRLRAAILNELSDFVIVDNLGGKSYFIDDDILSYIEERNVRSVSSIDSSSPKYSCYVPEKSNERWHIANGAGLFSPLVLFNYEHFRQSYSPPKEHLFFLSEFYGVNNFGEEGRKKLSLYFSFYIPKDKIMEYTNFTLERKTN